MASSEQLQALSQAIDNTFSAQDVAQLAAENQNASSQTAAVNELTAACVDSVGEKPPKGGLLLSDIPSADTSSKPHPICVLGSKRDISIKSSNDQDHPRNDGVVICLNSRETNYHVAFPYYDYITVKIDPEDYFVSVAECKQLGNRVCQTGRITNPSFSCAGSISSVEKMICQNDFLSDDSLTGFIRIFDDGSYDSR